MKCEKDQKPAATFEPANRYTLQPKRRQPATRDELVSLFSADNLGEAQKLIAAHAHRSRVAFFESVAHYAANGAVVCLPLTGIQVMTSTKTEKGVALVRLQATDARDFVFAVTVADLLKLGNHLSDEAKRLAKGIAGGPLVPDDLHQAFEINRAALDVLKKDAEQ
jgi:hypothetical protein